MWDSYVTALADNEVRVKTPAGRGVPNLLELRARADRIGYTGPIAWSVREGFTLSEYASKFCRCCDRLWYLQDSSFKKDVPTINSLVFVIPREPATWEMSPNENMNARLKDELQKKHLLPEAHSVNFGSAAINTALILAHFRSTGEKVEINCEYASVDLHYGMEGDPLVRPFHGPGLDCGCSYLYHIDYRIKLWLFGELQGN